MTDDIAANSGDQASLMVLVNDYVSLPLCVLVLLLVAWQARTDRRSLLCLLPLGFVLVVVAAVPGLLGSWIFRLVGIFVLSLTTLWLLVGWLGDRGPRARTAWALIIVLVSGALGLVGYPRLAFGIAEHICFALALVFGVVLARNSCGARFTLRRFTGFLLAWDIFLMVVLWTTAYLMLTALGHGSNLYFFLFMPQMTTGIALVDGVGLFLMELCFLAIIPISAFHRTRLARVLSVQDIPLLSPGAAAAPGAPVSLRRHYATLALVMLFGMTIGPLVYYGAFRLVVTFAPERDLWESEEAGEMEFPPPDLPVPVPVDLDFDIQTLNGEVMNVAEAFEGRVLLLNFWATWCPPCRAEMPSIETLYQEMGEDVAFALVSDEDTETIRSFLANENYTLPVYRIEGERPTAFDTEGIPATFVVSDQGNQVLKHVGGADWADSTVVDFLKDLSSRTFQPEPAASEKLGISAEKTAP